MGHYLKYRLKITLREKSIVFWSMVFPMILVTLFRFSFADLGKSENMDAVPVGIVHMQGDTEFEAFLQALDGDLLAVTGYQTREEALGDLEEKKIAGVYFLGKERSLSVKGQGIGESILVSLLDSYEKNETMVKAIAAEHPERLEDAAEEISGYSSRVREVGLGGKSLDTSLQFFFAGLAMACLYGCFFGFHSALDRKADSSPVGIRIGVSPANKLRMIIGDLLVLIGIHFAYMILLLLYMRYLLGIRLTDNWPGVLLVCFVGTTFGVAAGILTGSTGKLRASMKLGILTGSSLILSFLAGLMAPEMKNIVENTCPILNRMNPVALITDAFYCINVYDNPGGYARSLGILAAMAAVCLVFSFLAVRRERYDSI